MDIDALTPRQMMALPQLVMLHIRSPRPRSWVGDILGKEGVWHMGQRYVGVNIDDLIALEMAGFLTLELRPDRKQGYITLDETAHAAVHERFNLSLDEYVLLACFAASDGPPYWNFFKDDAVRHAFLKLEEFDEAWRSLLRQELVEEDETFGQRLFCSMSLAAVGRVKRKRKTMPTGAGDNIHITNSPNTSIVKGDGNQTCVHQTVNPVISGLLADIERHRFELDPLIPADTEDANHALDEVNKALETGGSDKMKSIRSAIRNFVATVPKGLVLNGILRQIATAVKMDAEDIRKLFNDWRL